jgi:small subunit ribosomal protein S13
MARILGVEIPDEKRAIIGLTSIYGVGVKTSALVLKATGIDPDRKISSLTAEEIKKLLQELSGNYKLEGPLRAEGKLAIKRLMDMGCYRGKRHREGRTVRGQRTKNNGRTNKGPKKNAIKKKKRT